MLKKQSRKEIKMAENAEKKLVVVHGEPTALNLEIDNLEVWVKTNEGERVGFAKIIEPAEDNREEVCGLTHFKTSMQNNILVDRMMLSGILYIAENYKAEKIITMPHPVDFKVEEEKVSPADVYKRLQKIGFDFAEKNADITAPNQKMIFKIK